MIRVLHNLAALDGGGDAKLLYEYYCNMDREKVHFDFLIYDFYDNGILEKPLKELGCNIYKIPRIKRDIRGFLKEMEKVIAEGEYDIVHSHMGARALYAMYFAKKHGVKRRIAHSHVAYEPVSKLKRCFNILISKLTMFYATDLFACGIEAGKYMWGKNAYRKEQIHIMTNAVDTQKYAFDAEMRIQKRKELGVEDKYVIGIVGRLATQKNYPFLLETFKKVLEKDENIVLVAAGRGAQEKEIKQKVVDLNLSESVKLLGVRDDVPQLLNAFDMFVLPSLFEGLPIVLIEAQANGLLLLVSDKITTEIGITDLVSFLPIDDTQELWAEKILEMSKRNVQREQYVQKVINAGYDIETESSKMETFYVMNAE